MGFSRARERASALAGDDLSAAMGGIGINLAVAPAPNPNIEDTLLFASIEGMERDDLRVLALLVTWLGIHVAWVNADRLVALVRAQSAIRVRAFWAAVAQWQGRDRRLARLRRLHRGGAVDLLAVGTEFQIRKRGEDPRFRGTALRVPAGVLRDRPADVLSPAQLARRHRAYRCRVIMGPSYRADMWAALELEPHLATAEVARRAYGSYATASVVRRGFALVASG
ncbi:MAG: hypothetical protein JXP73_00855 [Deltaproteobacteria bacterium]|nr:hypothetical protein [Deltaproteobacteria bacterium]